MIKLSEYNPILRKATKPRDIGEILPNIEEKPHEYRYQLLDQTKFDKDTYQLLRNYDIVSVRRCHNKVV